MSAILGYTTSSPQSLDPLRQTIIYSQPPYTLAAAI